jgi:hypothetical protein
VTLNDFNSPRAIRIAKIALRGMRRDTALQEGFPPPGRRISLSWSIMCREAFPDKELKAKMEEAQGDEDLKAKLVAYVSHYFPWIRDEDWWVMLLLTHSYLDMERQLSSERNSGR